MRFSTRAIHVGQDADAATGATIVPIYQTATYTQEGLHQHKGYEYARSSNPTRTALETCLASLENGKFGLAFGSGMAAESAVMNLLSAGDHVVSAEDLYGGTYRMFEGVYRRYGIDITYVDARMTSNIEQAIRPDTKLVWIETPTNPLLQLVDIAAAAVTTRPRRIPLVVDNTFASSALQNPLDLGADIVVHSTTKYLGGHSDVVGGAVVTNDEELHSQIKFHQNALGGVPGPFDCWLVLRGVKTLQIRMQDHCANATAIAHFLVEHPGVEIVHYPGLASHPQHALATRQMRGYGGMLSFAVKGGFEAAKRVMSTVKIFALAESLGGVESLMGYPAAMSHVAVPEEERNRRGITAGLIRLSVGIEDVEDLIEDLRRAL